MNELDKIFSQSKHANTFATGYLNYLNRVLSGFNVEEISAFVKENIPVAFGQVAPKQGENPKNFRLQYKNSK